MEKKLERVSKQVIVMRRDLKNAKGEKVRTGKLMAQAAHASLKAILDNMNWSKMRFGYGIVNEAESQCGGDFILRESNITDAMKDWLTGRFTKVCVSVNSEAELIEVYNKAKEKGLICSLITDAGLTEFGGVPTITCCAIGPVWSNEVDEITGKLFLL